MGILLDVGRRSLPDPQEGRPRPDDGDSASGGRGPDAASPASGGIGPLEGSDTDPLDFEFPGEADYPVTQLLPAEDRIWHHPSELARLGTAHEPGGHRGHRWGPRHRRQLRWAVPGVVAVFVVGILVLPVISPAQRGTGPAAGPALRPPAEARAVSAVNPAQAATVAISITRPGAALAVTGVAVDGGSMVLTPAHVLSGLTGADSISVDAPGHPPAPGRVVATTSKLDLAVISVPGVTVPVPPVAPAPGWSAPESGYIVFNDNGRLRTSMMTAQARPAGDGGDLVPNFIRIFATGSGNAHDLDGSAVVNGTGQLVGMVDRHDPGGGLDAIPSNLLVPAMTQLAVAHQLRYGWLGVTASDQATGAGVLIQSVMPGGPAAGAGLHPGETIVSVDGDPIGSLAALVSALWMIGPDQAVVIGISPGSASPIPVTLASQVN